MKELKEFSSEEEYVPRSIQYIVVHCSATRANIPLQKNNYSNAICNVVSNASDIIFISPGTENFITAVRYQSRVRMCEALTQCTYFFSVTCHPFTTSITGFTNREKYIMAIIYIEDETSAHTFLRIGRVFIMIISQCYFH